MTLAMPDPMNGVAQFNQFRQMTPSVSLSRLIDFSIQRTYHELQVLADLLPRKTDMERKIEIVSFSSRTRQTFIRLLALVKWAGSASKVEKCANIVSFLDKQSMLFTETADVLSKMARETMVSARLPSFQLPAAVEVLTLGTYSRLPTCIRERIVPPDPITPSEKRATLLRLNQIIQQRLVTSSLPNQMRNLKIENGRVTFHVNYEFELCLTLMGDSAVIPWRVLNVDILVMDKETGDGRELVHPRQIIYIQDLVQSRLIDNSRPLVDAYIVLHSFCLSLQLEVLHAQTMRLGRERLGDFIRIDEYHAGKRLAIMYWIDLSAKDSKYQSKLTIEVDVNEQSKLLQILHSPDMGEKETLAANDSIKSDHLSIEKLLIHTIHERAKQSLEKLRLQFDEASVGDTALSGCPPILEVSFLNPCMQSEKLLISVDMLSGIFMAHISQFDECPLLSPSSFKAVIKDQTKTKSWIRELRIWTLKERCKKTAEALPVFVHETLPIANSKSTDLISQDTSKLFFQFSKHHNNFLMVEFKENDATKEIDQKYYLMAVQYLALDGCEPSNGFETDMPKPFLNILSVFELDILSLFGDKSKLETILETCGKRKLFDSDSKITIKRPKMSGFFVPNLAYLISFCEEKLAYGALSAELQRRGICNQVRIGNEPGNTHLVDIVEFPTSSSAPMSKLQQDLLNSTIRLQGKGSKIWNVSLCLSNCPIQTLVQKENGLRRMVYLMYEFSNGSQAQIVQMVDELLEDWSAIAKLYDVVYEFGKVASNFSSIVEIKSYTYKKLFLNYGPNKSFMVSLLWKSAEKRFQLHFGVTGVGASNSNPHVLVSSQLQHEFNHHQSLATLLHTLSTTFSPLLTLLSLTSIPLLGVINSRPQVPVQTIVLIPQTSTHIRLLYRSSYCVDIVIQSDGLVAVRDGAYSLFDKGKALEELAPIQGLKAFLSKFVDKSATQMRRLSQTEDDNPPSPIIAHMDSVESYMFTPGMKSSPSVGGDGNVNSSMRQHHTVGSMGSNPNTPASPHTSMLSQVGYVASPSTAFSLASPPSHGLGGHPAGQMHPAPSPSMPGNHPEPSPANMFNVNSPMNSLHAQSPSFLTAPSPGPSTHMQSPAPNYMSNQTGHDHSQVQSPFQTPTANMSMSSPGAAAWPGSPSIPRPSPSRPMGSVQSPASCGQPLGIGQSPQTPTSHQMPAPHAPFTSSMRIIPQRSWAAAIPTLLTHQGFDHMCRSNSGPDNPVGQSFYGSITQSLSQLDRFLGCVSMRRHLQRVIQQDDKFNLMHSPEPGIIQFRNEAMQFKIFAHPTTMQSLHLKIAPADQHKNQWHQEELEVLERFFEAKVVCAPYKPNAFLAYGRLLNAPYKVLKDSIQLMKSELNQDKQGKWYIQWCLTIPPAAPLTMISPGMSAVLILNNTTLLLFLQLTRVAINLPVGVDPQSTVVPFLYDMNNNILKVADRNVASNFLGVVNNHLKRFYEYGHPLQPGECSLFPAIRDIMMSDLV